MYLIINLEGDILAFCETLEGAKETFEDIVILEGDRLFDNDPAQFNFQPAAADAYAAAGLAIVKEVKNAE